MTSQPTPLPVCQVSLFWLPLGADGNPVVRWSGHVYEAVAARREGRDRLYLFHSALRVQLDGSVFVVEMAPAWGAPAGDRGVVSEGPVGLACLGRSRLFRYEIRRWRNGVIPDADRAVDSPVDLGATDGQARAVLAVVPECPAAVWGRDDLAAGDMWNSNSLVSWLLRLSGHDVTTLDPPPGGRAPGWAAGLQVAARQLAAGLEPERPRHGADRLG